MNRSFNHASEEAVQNSLSQTTGSSGFGVAQSQIDAGDPSLLTNDTGEGQDMNLVASASAPQLGLQLEMVHSAPGQLKVRCVVPSQDRVARLVSERRVKELLKSNVAAATITQELGKHFRKSGYLLPKYGITVQVRKSVDNTVRPSMSSSTLSLGQKTKLPDIAGATR